jgi:hypothetical protein
LVHQMGGAWVWKKNNSNPKVTLYTRT